MIDTQTMTLWLVPNPTHVISDIAKEVKWVQVISDPCEIIVILLCVLPYL